jgi:hypothetical protein
MKDQITLEIIKDRIAGMDVLGEEFGEILVTVLEKFVNENDDMAIMNVHKCASDLLTAINEI